MRHYLLPLVGLTFVGLNSVASPAAAQAPAAGERDPNGRVLAKVVAKMPEPGNLGYPIQGLRLFVVTEDGNKVPIQTDAAGVASTWLRPGTYRFVTRSPIEWDGKAYSWDMLIPVRPGMGIIALSRSNATKIVALATEATAEAKIPQASAPSRSDGERPVLGRRRTTSSGFWLSAGLGFGSLGCNICVGYLGGASAGFSVGGSLNSRVLVGIGATGWTSSQDKETLLVGMADARLRFYPRETSGLFLTAGGGVGFINAGVATDGKTTETGVGLVVGAGMDFRVTTNLSVTPFWSGLGIKTSASNATVSQIGLGLTVH